MPELNHPRYHQYLKASMRRLSKELKGPMAGFAQLHAKSMGKGGKGGDGGEGALSPKAKELMALAIAICVRCDGCVAYHVHDALRAGATRAEILETIGVAIMMGGGPATIYGCEAFEALDQFETDMAEERAASQLSDPE
ncbi:MAG: carboxymuconolactone decarboxylase family protein [Blastocatellia bacterium]|nr:carboxymuconolactone decarboxylase family protein [Blastocatellia bacterium]